MKHGLAEFLENYSVSGVRAYVMTTVAVLTATALRIQLNPVLGDTTTPAFHAIALVLVAGLAGFKASVFGVALALLVNWFVLPVHGLSLSEKIANRLAMAIGGIFVCGVTASLRTSLIESVRAERKADFLVREMHHRVKNLFAVVTSMLTLASREEPEASATLNKLRARIQSLASTHDLAVGPPENVCIRKLVDRLMAPHATPGPMVPRVKTSGASVDVPADYTTPLVLIFNELATNAVKYGALARRNGTVTVSWSVRDEWLDIVWKETGANLAGRLLETGRPGFGSLLVEASVRQMRGKIDRTLTDDGLVVRISVPLPDAPEKLFRSDLPAARQEACDQPQSFLSALRASKSFFRRRPQIKDSRS